MVAADSGLDLARLLGVPVDLVVGDFDSADPAGVAAAVAAGSRLERHPVDKDATDLELALDAVLRLGRSPRADPGRGRLGPPRPPGGQLPPGRFPPLSPPCTFAGG